MANACTSPEWSLKQWLQNADAVYYGQVISLAVANESSDFYEVFEEATPSVIDREIKFRVLSEIKGIKSESGEIEAILSWCGGGEAEFLGKAIFVLQNGEWTAFNKKEDVKWFLSHSPNG